jgi:S-adenosylmethionine/arginine decarboxylase-like enzyme
MWGRHLVLDCSSCDREAVRDAEAIRGFCADLVSSIGMVAYGDPVLEHFATHLPEAAGYSLVQLIETSAVTGHFCDASGDAYLDVFSCKDFDPTVAVDVVLRYFRPKLIRRIDLCRGAPRVSGGRSAELRRAQPGAHGRLPSRLLRHSDGQLLRHSAHPPRGGGGLGDPLRPGRQGGVDPRGRRVPSGHGHARVPGAFGE